jgi:hypothetical protein
MLLFYLTYIVPGSILIPLIWFASGYRRMGAPERLIALYLLISGLINLAALLLSTHNLSNLWLLHIYTAVEGTLLLLFFRVILANRKIRRVILLLVVAFPIVCLLNALCWQSSAVFNTYTRPVEALLCVGLAACYWLQDSGEHHDKWGSDPRNWEVTGLFIYFASSFLLFLFSNVLLSRSASPANSRLWDLLWAAHATLVLVMYLLITVGFHIRSTIEYG